MSDEWPIDIGFVWLVPNKGSIDWDATQEDADDE